jgi:hypothetical protein
MRSIFATRSKSMIVPDGGEQLRALREAPARELERHQLQVTVRLP